MQKDLLLIDTNVIIDYLRNDLHAVHYLEKLSAPISLSAISVAEIYAGIRNKIEEKAVQHLLSIITILPTDQNIAAIAGTFYKHYKKSHGVDLADAIIAATSQLHEATLVTLNTKHFPMIKTIKPYKK